ncbi:acyl-CoA thioesterase, partial [Nodularia sp. UHCC 0506]|nr:acyl-CoA thioesterase [Nodularia sp. UHCC 0506]
MSEKQPIPAQLPPTSAIDLPSNNA